MDRPEYKDWKINGEAVKKHFNQVKDATAKRYGWASPETGNLSDLAGNPDKLTENIKMVWLEEEEIKSKAAVKDDLKKELDDTANQVVRAEKATHSRRRRFFNLSGEVVDSKGNKKIKIEDTPPVTASSISSVGQTDDSKGSSNKSDKGTSRAAPGSRFNPLDVDSLLGFIQNPNKEKIEREEKEKQEEAWREKILDTLAKEYQPGSPSYCQFQNLYRSDCSEESKNILNKLPFPLLLHKYKRNQSDEHIVHLTRLGVSYVDAHLFRVLVDTLYDQEAFGLKYKAIAMGEMEPEEDF